MCRQGQPQVGQALALAARHQKSAVTSGELDSRPPLLCPRGALLPVAPSPLHNAPHTLCTSTAPLQQEQAHQQHQGVHAALQSRWACPLGVGGAPATPRSSITELQVLTSPVQNRRPPCGPSTGEVGALSPEGTCRGGLPSGHRCQRQADPTWRPAGGSQAEPFRGAHHKAPTGRLATCEATGFRPERRSRIGAVNARSALPAMAEMGRAEQDAAGPPRPARALDGTPFHPPRKRPGGQRQKP